MKRLLLSIACLFMLTGSIWAQERAISGKISDASGEALPGVTVLVKGTTTGTQSDFEGNYKLNVPADGTHLIFSFVGMATKEVEIGNQTEFSITMEEDAQQLSEIVVTALGIKRTKKSLGYAQQTVETDELISSKQSDVVNAMAGKIAGVQVMAAPKSGFNQSQLRLRGSTNVLYVVDGIRLASSDDINPEDVASMSVLKGGAATALYGPDGINGVVIITTTRGKKGDNGTIIYDGSVEIGDAAYVHELQDQYGGGYSQSFNQFSYRPGEDPESWAAFDGDNLPDYHADESWGPKLDGTMVRPWYSWIEGNSEFGKSSPWTHKGGLDDFFETSVNTKHSVTFLKGGDDYNLKVNVLRNVRTLNIPNSERTNNRVSLAAGYNVTPKLNVSTNIAYQNRATLNNPATGYNSIGSNVYQWFQSQLDVDRIKEYRQGGKIVSWNIKSPRDPSPLYWDSPYFEFNENLKHNTRNSLIGDLSLKYKINELFSTNLSVKKTYTRSGFDNRVAFGGLNQTDYTEGAWITNRDLMIGQLLYNQKFDDITVSSILGFETASDQRSRTRASSVGGLTLPGFYNVATSQDRPSYSFFERAYKTRGAYLTATVGYKDMLFFDGSVRRDWNSTAKVGDNAVTTKGATLSFIVSELIPENDILSYAKLRGGVAQAPRFPNPYQLSQTFQRYAPYNGNPILGTAGGLSNGSLTGGLRSEFEIGTELRFLQGKIGLDVTYFSKKDTDLPTNLALDPTTGYTSTVQNAGEYRYKGVEFAISGTPIDTDDFSWNTSFNFATLRRDVIELGEGITRNDQRFVIDRWGGLNLREEEGKRWGELYGGKVQTINGKKVIAENATYVTEADQHLGNYLPDFTGGFVNRLKYKDFTLGIDMDYQIGGQYFSVTKMFINLTGLGEATVGNNNLGNPLRDPVVNSAGEEKSYVLANEAGTNSGGTLMSGVTPDGDDVAYYVDTQRYWGNQFGNISEFTYDASYLSVRNVRLGYNLPSSITEKLHVKTLNLAFYINNALLLFSDLPNIDPSQLEHNANIAADPAFSSDDLNPQFQTINIMEGGQLPGVRTYGFNVRISL